MSPFFLGASRRNSECTSELQSRRLASIIEFAPDYVVNLREIPIFFHEGDPFDNGEGAKEPEAYLDVILDMGTENRRAAVASGVNAILRTKAKVILVYPTPKLDLTFQTQFGRI